jgi:hypothetical protein
MKKKLFIFSAIMLGVASVNSTIAQNVVASASQEYETYAVPVETQNVSSSSINDVSQTVQKKFEKQFPEVSGETWIKTHDGYVVRFNSDDINNWVFLDKKGNVVGTMRYYDENDLPSDIRDQVKTRFYDYKIISVQEVTVANSTAYLVSIKANHEWKIIKVGEEEVSIYKEYEDGQTSGE